MSKPAQPSRLKEIRRANLARLVAEAKSQIAFAEECELSPVHLNHMLTGFRGVGDRSAAKIEKLKTLHPGWMDEDRSNLPATLSPAGIKAGLIYDQLSPEDQPRHLIAMEVAAEIYLAMKGRGKGARPR